jgi:hypothetical protein
MQQTGKIDVKIEQALKDDPVPYVPDFLAAHPEVPGSIPGATRFSE